MRRQVRTTRRVGAVIRMDAPTFVGARFTVLTAGKRWLIYARVEGGRWRLDSLRTRWYGVKPRLVHRLLNTVLDKATTAWLTVVEP